MGLFDHPPGECRVFEPIIPMPPLETMGDVLSRENYEGNCYISAYYALYAIVYFLQYTGKGIDIRNVSYNDIRCDQSGDAGGYDNIFIMAWWGALQPAQIRDDYELIVDKILSSVTDTETFQNLNRHILIGFFYSREMRYWCSSFHLLQLQC